MKKYLFILISCILLLQTSLSAEEYSGDVYVTGVSKYLWRGQELFDKAAFQPGLDLNYKKLSLNLSVSYDLVDSKADLGQANDFGEADVTISFSDSYKMLGYSLGYTYYTFPNILGFSSEYFIGLSVDVLLSPGLTMYYDIAKKGGDGGYLEFALAFPFKLGIDFSLDSSVGYNFGQWGYKDSFSVAGLGLGTTYSIGSVDLSPSVFGQYALDTQYKSSHNKFFDWYASFGITYNF